MAKVTISDIAREAGVSRTTVSRYNNGNFTKMSQETKDRIEATIARLGYRPSASAQRLRQQHTNVVGVIVADISNVFSSLLFKGIIEQLQPAGYDVMLMDSNNSASAERTEINRMLAQEVDGLIIQPNCADHSAYTDLDDMNLPLVMVDREPANQASHSACIVSDNHSSCVALGRELADRGYNNVVALTRTRSQISAQTPRVEGLREACETHGMLLVPLEADSHDVDWLQREIATLLDHLNGRTALVSMMGPMLFDTLAVLRALGKRFPDDVGLVSFDDWDWSQYVHDGIYLLEQSPRDMGRHAADNLLRQMAAPTPSDVSERVELPVTVVEAPSI